MTKKNNKKYILFINASRDKELDVFLILGNRVVDRLVQTGDYKVTEYLLKLIERILRNNKVKTADLNGIIAVTGPGPFTSLRITAAVANTLAYSLQIPVVGIINKQGLTDNEDLVKLGLKKITKAKAFRYVSPFYDRGPNITIAKK
ncbi:MAG: tRNA (adenosine(37)-N6)-threonylcarbamoyltransferase complex dimerization subunit type 1 TsaB [Candidatus Parcubacteria bacterium]|nr:tRNA (adenosine(37)-N6)-threonylcarbamoyltransferase complex dimerization subunit type 1 TsaB [Candidatus Parcubacteria bacterium]